MAKGQPGTEDGLIAAMTRNGAVQLNSWQLERLWKAVTVKDRGPGKHADMNKEFIGKNASVLLREIGISAGPEVRQIVAEVGESFLLMIAEDHFRVRIQQTIRIEEQARGSGARPSA